MNSSLLKEIWLFISAFGIMFAILSWLQESSILSSELGWIKGFFASLTGLFLYLIFRKSL